MACMEAIADTRRWADARKARLCGRVLGGRWEKRRDDGEQGGRPGAHSQAGRRKLDMSSCTARCSAAGSQLGPL